MEQTDGGHSISHVPDKTGRVRLSLSTKGLPDISPMSEAS